jgi:hypothetical protein
LEVGKYCIAKIKYPDAKNFEGIKILVYKAHMQQIVSATRFIPTDGLGDGVQICGQCIIEYILLY